MNRKTIIPAASVLLSLVCASLLFLNWNPEALFRQEETPVTRNGIEQGGTEDFTGSAAGGDCADRRLQPETVGEPLQHAHLQGNSQTAMKSFTKFM